MARPLTIALTETKNAYDGLPDDPRDFPRLAPVLEDIRRANVAHHMELAREARDAGARVVCFGEAFTGPYFALTVDPVWHGLAEPLDGPTVRELAPLARELDMVIVAPIYELDPSSGKRFNTAVVIDADGSVLGFYSKTHIPHGANEQNRFSEGFYFERSTGRPQSGPKLSSVSPFFPVFHTKVARLGVAICYDRHFEGVMSSLKDAGAELVLSPAVTFGAKSERMWAMEFAVDAMRHRMFIGGSNRLGVERPWGQPYFGQTHVVSPDGRLANDAKNPKLVVSTLDLALLDGTDSSGWRTVEDARPGIYSRRRG